MDFKNKSFLDLGSAYVDAYLKGTINEFSIAKSSVIRECLYECYKILTRKKELVPIEAMTGEEKTDLWNESKKYCEPLSETDRIKFVKAYAALSCLMSKRL